MRRPRVKADGEGFYHVVSRIGGKRFLIDEAEKGILLGMIRAAAAFSGVELYTFAIMSNHFHLLVRVPRKREVSDAELLRRMEALYGRPRFRKVLEKWEKWEERDQADRVAEEKARLRARMYDLSQFCKTFKETYTQDYNRRHGNTGTIWEGRFKSILLEGSFRALMTVAGYVHLNPVRAQIADTPEASPWTGYGAGCQGDEPARNGLRALVSRALRSEAVPWECAQEVCAREIGGAIAGPQDPPPSDPGGPPPGASSLLRQRVAEFLHGGALGGAAFLRRASALLPPRIRRRARCPLDDRPELGLAPASGVRGAS